MLPHSAPTAPAAKLPLKIARYHAAMVVAASPGGASYVLFTLPAAQRLVAEPGMVDTIGVVAAKGVSQQQVTANISKQLPSGVEALTGKAMIAETQDNLKQQLKFFNTFMLTFAVIALFVGIWELCWAIGWADRDEIDCLNILQATFLAMRRALLALPVAPTHVRVDGNRCPCIADLPFTCTLEAIIAGDARVAAISAASILAKTHRDAMMEALDRCYPGFALATHKGYGTPEHLDALRLQAPSPLHRRSFRPVRGEAPQTLSLEFQVLGLEE